MMPRPNPRFFVPWLALLTGAAVWLAVGSASLVTGETQISWWVLWLVFGIAMPFGHEWHASQVPNRAGQIALGIQVIAALGLIIASGAIETSETTLGNVSTRDFIPFLLMINAGKAAIHLPIIGGIPLIAFQTAAVAIVDSAAPEASAVYVTALIASGQIIIFTWAVSSTRSRKLQESLERTLVELRTTGAMLRASERKEERASLLDDLHDSLGHSLTALILQVETARADPRRNAEMLGLAETTARKLLQEVRQILTRRREDLRVDIQQMVDEANLAYTKGEITAELPTLLSISNPDVGKLVYQAAQEGLTNAMRHSDAENISLSCRLEENFLLLTIQDDGAGDNSGESTSDDSSLRNSKTKSRGLKSLEERTRKVGGALEAGKLHPRGFKLELRIPTEGLFAQPS